MPVAWRQLFDELNVEWVDRGPNTSRGHICIACPFCGDDPSHHLSISESKDLYYCYREPRHGGSSLSRLLLHLGVGYVAIPELLNRHNTELVYTPRPRKLPGKTAQRWTQFESAADNPVYLNYLRNRGFPTPVSLCRQYDLRYAPEGSWARRLLLPIRLNEQVVSWTGRAIDPWLTPKYLTEQTDVSIVYLPRMVRRTLIIVEGPLDALKIAYATDSLPISSLAVLGKGMSPGKMDRITELAKRASNIAVALDTDVNIVTAYDLVHELAAATQREVARLELPYGVSDPGEMEVDQIHGWLEREASPG